MSINNEKIVFSINMNVFVLVTPFQLFVVRRLISQYHREEDNLIVSTIKGKRDFGTLNVVRISRGIKGFYKTWKLKRFLINYIDSLSFFIPHVGTLFSSYFFELAKVHNRPINVYYEGIAMFYDPIRPNLKAKRERMLMGALMGIRYRHYEQLYPDDLIHNAEYCYSPVNINLDRYKRIRIIDLKKQESKISSNILVLTSNTATKEIADGVCAMIPQYCKDNEQITIYVKPHYSLPDNMVDYYLEKVRSLRNDKVVLLNKMQPIEELYSSFSFGTIISQVFSSSLINAKIIFGDDIRIIIYQKDTINIDIANKMQLKCE